MGRFDRLSQSKDPLQEVCDRLRDALQLHIEVVDQRVEVALPDGKTTLLLGTAPRPNGPIRFYIGAALRPDAPLLAQSLSRAFGGGSVVRVAAGKELRQLSPYGPADVLRTPDEATEWFLGKVTAAWDAAEKLDAPASSPVTVTAPVAAPLPEAEALRRRVIALDAEIAQLRAALAAQALDTDRADESVNRLVELEAEVAALRTDRDETRQLLGEADTEAVELRAALRDAHQTAQMATRGAAEAEAELSNAVAQLDEVRQQATAESATGLSSQELADGIVEILDFALRDGSIPFSSMTPLLERAYALVRGEQRVASQLAEQYMRVDRPGDAIAALGSLSAALVSPTSAALLVEAYLQLKKPPPDEVVERADWSRPSATKLLPLAVAWLPPDVALRLSAALVRNPPDTIDAWFAALDKSLPDAKLGQLHESWTIHDADRAARAVLRWIDSRRVSVGDEWVVAALRHAIGSQDRSDAVESLKRLLEAAVRRGDRELLSYLAMHGPRLAGRDWLDIGVEIARATARMRGRLPASEQEVLLVADLYSLARSEDDAASRRALRALAEAIRMQADANLRPVLDRIVQEVQLQQPSAVATAVQTVAEVLENVALRHPRLIVLPEARESAKQRGIRGAKKAQAALEALGALAGQYATGVLKRSVSEECRLLPGYTPSISQTAKQKYLKDYERSLPDGRIIVLGPHIDGGAKEGRIYFFVDEELKRIVVGHVGRHLRGQRDG